MRHPILDRPLSRRDLLRVAGIGAVVAVAGLPRVARADEPAAAARDEFWFLQLSDTHIGFTGPAVNPDPEGTLAKAIAAINARGDDLPDFVVFTGDLTHATEDAAERRARMRAFQARVAELRIPHVRYLPGEHDAPDGGAVYRELFGATRYAFDHKGVHFIALDNVTDPHAELGAEQLAWLQADLATQPKDARIVVLTHRPLFDLAPEWDWSTRDGQAALDLLMPFANVTVLYGHIHQAHHAATKHIQHHAAHGLMFALPAPGSAPKKSAVKWDPAHPYAGLGYEDVAADVGAATITPRDRPVAAP